MNDTNRVNEENSPGDSPEWPQATCTPEQRRMIRKGVRIWAKVAIRSYMRNNEAGSQAEADGGEGEAQ